MQHYYNVAIFVQCYKVCTSDPGICYVFKGYLHIVQHLAHIISHMWNMEKYKPWNMEKYKPVYQCHMNSLLMENIHQQLRIGQRIYVPWWNIVKIRQKTSQIAIVWHEPKSVLHAPCSQDFISQKIGLGISKISHQMHAMMDAWIDDITNLKVPLQSGLVGDDDFA